MGTGQWVSHILPFCLLKASFSSFPVVQFDFLHSPPHQVTPPISPAHTLLRLSLWTDRREREEGEVSLIRDLIWSSSLLQTASFCCKFHLTVWGVNAAPASCVPLPLPPPPLHLSLTPDPGPQGKPKLRAGCTLPPLHPFPSIYNRPPPLSLPFLPQAPVPLPPAALPALDNRLMWTNTHATLSSV